MLKRRVPLTTVLTKFIFATFIFAAFILNAKVATAGDVTFKNDQLHVDGIPQPQFFGAEVQYFRLRGGQGRNIPREKVIALWNRALDHLVEAKANAISFYIPWDFHEYAPGKFDFDGSVDEDGDGKPDYPSRDLKTWFKLVEAHGIKHILVRPGPYINAEWGFLGFGAVPLWFHEAHPASHMLNSKGQKTSLYSYNDPDFLRESRNWLETLYRDVLAQHIGPGRPIDFLQLDNETNFQWQSIYNVDYSPRAIKEYQDFLKASYSTLEALNRAHGRDWPSWEAVAAPTQPGLNLGEDQDWYRFQDHSIHGYLVQIRKIWENLGVTEPHVLFTLAESYNAADHGLLPNYELRNDPGQTGLMTVNLYPKTAGSTAESLLNQPFKADHDVKAAVAANAHYYGRSEEWSMGPEIQGGWWRGTEVSAESRRQTYLSTIGHGLKGLFVYYFNEGNNWEYDWAKKQIQPFYDALKHQPQYNDLLESNLPAQFWTELDQLFADRVLAGWNVRSIMASGGTQSESLYFDAPLGGDAKIQPGFQALKEIGENVVAPYGDFLGSAVEITDPVCLIKDHHSNVPSGVPGLDSTLMNSYWAGGLLSYFFHSGVNPKIIQWGLTPSSDLESCHLLAIQDNGINSNDLVKFLRDRLQSGATVLTFISHDLSDRVVASENASCRALSAGSLNLSGKVCTSGRGHFFQVDQPFYQDFNSDSYAKIDNIVERRRFLDGVLAVAHVAPALRIAEGADRIVAFGRRPTPSIAKSDARIWVTVKSGRVVPESVHIVWSEAIKGFTYKVTDVFKHSSINYPGQTLATAGFSVNLGAGGSTALMIEPVIEPALESATHSRASLQSLAKRK